MGKLVALILLILSLNIEGCIAQRPWGAKRDTDFCYTGTYTGIDTLINVNGYYYFTNGDSSRYDGGSYFFFIDGFFAYSPFSNPNLTIANNGEIKKIEKTINDYFTGVYKIENGTIKAQFSNPPNSMSWAMTELWFKIVDSNTLMAVRVPDAIIKKEQKIRNTTAYRHQQAYKISFVPMKTLPNPEKSWIKKRKWFWCNDTLYKKWMEKNQKKKNR